MNDLTDLERKILESLRANTEGGEYKNPEGETFSDVYLDSARPPGMSERQFNGLLGSLEKKGLYIPNTDPDFAGTFGVVKLN